MRRPTLLVVVLLGLGLATTAGAQDMERGKQLFSLCAHCHGAHAEGKQLALAPSIAGLGQWYIEKQIHNFKDGIRAMHFDDLAGMRMRPMARWLKTDEDVKSVAAYVASLPPVRPAPTLTGGDPAKGAPLYATCSGCHGTQGEGVEAIGGPALSHISDFYFVTQMKNYQQGIRGSDPRDVTGAAMRPMSMILADPQAQKDMLAYLQTLPLPGAAAAAKTGGE
jgi:cytochrome c oxidase subunit 2